jgi:hypothetical protein
MAFTDDVIDQFGKRTRCPGLYGLRRAIFRFGELFEKLGKRDVLL